MLTITVSNALHPFLQFQLTVCCHFCSFWRASLSVSCRAGLLSINMNSLWFCLFGSAFIFKEYFCWILKFWLTVSAFGSLKMSFHCLLLSSFSDGKSAKLLALVSCRWGVRFPCCFQNLFVFGFQRFGYYVSKYGCLCIPSVMFVECPKPPG